MLSSTDGKRTAQITGTKTRTSQEPEWVGAIPTYSFMDTQCIQVLFYFFTEDIMSKFAELYVGGVVSSAAVEAGKVKAAEKARKARRGVLGMTNKELGNMYGCTKRQASKLKDKTLKGELVWLF